MSRPSTSESSATRHYTAYTVVYSPVSPAVPSLGDGSVFHCRTIRILTVNAKILPRDARYGTIEGYISMTPL